MNFRCLTCGYVQDFPPSEESMRVHFPHLEGKSTECPACRGYLKTHGGRKNGKIEMPDIVEPGTLEDESLPEVAQKLKELDADFEKLSSGDETLKDKYKNKKLFGWTPDELIAMHVKRESPKE